MRYLLVLSDAHLATAPKRAGPWLAHRQPASLADQELAGVLESAVRTAAADRAELEVVLNGDVFDLDGPIEESPGATRSADAAAREMRRIFHDHPLVTRALARVLWHGHRVILVPGNHDAQLALQAVREVITSALALEMGVSRPRGPSTATLGALQFRAWFHRTPDGVHVEHGHQYDPLCAHDRLFGTPRPDGGELTIEPTVANLVSAFAQTHLGTLNPHASDPASLVDGAVRAMGTSAALDPRRLAPSLALAKLLRDVALIKPAPMGPDEHGAWLRIVANETGAPFEALAKHAALESQKSDAAALLSVAGAVPYGQATDARLRQAMRQIAKIYRPSAVVFGHTHIPFVEESFNDSLLLNSGSWAPAAPSPDATVKTRVGAAPAGTFVWLGTDRGRVVAGGVRAVPRRSRARSQA